MQAQSRRIVVQTDENALVFTVGDNGRLYQSYFGKRLLDEAEYANLPRGTEAYLTHGMEDYFEPALHINRNDGNSSTLLAYCKQAIKDYNRLKPIILDGDQYRLVSPYDGNHASTMFVDKSSATAVLFTFDIHPRFNEKLENVKLQGLKPEVRYDVKEINKEDGSTDEIGSYSGDYLMTVGLPLLTRDDLRSRVFELSVSR